MNPLTPAKGEVERPSGRLEEGPGIKRGQWSLDELLGRLDLGIRPIPTPERPWRRILGPASIPAFYRLREQCPGISGSTLETTCAQGTKDL